MFRWYVINTYSGHENKVKANLEHRIISMNQAPRFRRVVVPTEQVIETKDGQKVQIEKRVLPGYVLVNMDLDDDAWGVVKNTPGVTGFVGAGNTPVPLSQPEVDRILRTGTAIGERQRDFFIEDAAQRGLRLRHVESPAATRRSVSVFSADGTATVLNEQGDVQPQEVWDEITAMLAGSVP